MELTAGIFAGVFMLVVISRSAEACGEGRMSVHSRTALTRGFPRDMTFSQRGLTSRQAVQDDFLDMLFPTIKDAVDYGYNLLQAISWPISISMGLFSAAMSQIGAFITWFNFLVSFITLGGAGASLLAWLRGDPAKMLRGAPWASHGVIPRQSMDSDLLDNLWPIIKDAVSFAWDILQTVGWPISLGFNLHSAFISQIGAFISWFNFLVSFITPGGAGAGLLAWLRGGPTKMSRGTPWPSQGITPRQSMDSDLLLDNLWPIIKDAVSFAWDILQAIGWPISLGFNLHSAFISQIGAFISWFNFLVSFITPGGAGAGLLAWLRSDPAKMSRDAL